MIGFLRLAVFGFIALTIIYWLVSIYSRSVRRERLEKEFDAGGIEGDRDDYIKAGMHHYQHGLRRRLIILIYVVPILIAGITIYYVNW